MVSRAVFCIATGWSLVAAAHAEPTAPAEKVAVGGTGAADRILERTPIAELRRLAESGDTRAQYHFGVELLKGERVPTDPVQGYAWIETAADCAEVCSSADASAAAQDARLKLHRMLSGAQLLEAERLSQSFLATRLAAYRQAALGVEQALLGQSRGHVTLRQGCAAAPTLSGCGAMPRPAAQRRYCSGIVEQPDRSPSDRGPLARLGAPRYPPGAVEKLVEGRVVIEAHVDSTGFVCEAGVVRSSGDAAIDGAALDALLRWRFEPAVLRGDPVEALFRMTIDFSLANDDAA